MAAWGNGDHGRLGHGGACASTDVPRAVASPLTMGASAVTAGGAHTAVITANGAVATCGLNDAGQLGRGAGGEPGVPHAAATGLASPVVALAAGHYHTLAVSASGEVLACGRNDAGQLGLGWAAGGSVAELTRVDALADAGVRVVAVAAGAKHSLALADDGAVYAWGLDDAGALGMGKAEASRWRFRLTSGEPLPRLVAPLAGEKVVALSAGHAHSMAVLEDGTLLAFGQGRFGQLGLGGSADTFEPTEVPELPPIKAVACGGLFTVALSRAGAAFSFGANENGSLGLGSKFDGPTNVAQPIPKLGMLTAVSAGWKHAAAVGVEGELYTWGWGGSVGSFTLDGSSGGGQLGLGDENDYWDPTCVRALTGPVGFGRRILEVSCGFNHTVALVEEGGR